MTPRLQLEHALEGTVRACGQLKELKAKEGKQSSLPTQVQLVKKLHAVEGAMYSQHAQVAKWFLQMMEILG